MSIYIKHHLKPLVESVEMFPNLDLGSHALLANFKTKVRVVVFITKPGSSDDGITDAIDENSDIITCLYTFKYPGKKQDFRTADPPEDDDPRLECGPDPWHFVAHIDWEGDDDLFQCPIDPIDVQSTVGLWQISTYHVHT
ncbi:hypothetical protein CEXT_747611 [Caerostris extrusa]|uniref:Uncharacterized protein n=1 Tax=Caerostris extrusa TaxID=172846 RepID=A0AAV4T4I6_CAEEX|nr:hypothetical protein CEXT_747611 [Caerostris extrusa]